MWENLGWHYTITKGKFKMMRFKDGMFSCVYDGATLQVITHAKDPKQALAFAIEDVGAAIKCLRADLKEIVG